jgi:hypothetical protein
VNSSLSELNVLMISIPYPTTPSSETRQQLAHDVGLSLTRRPPLHSFRMPLVVISIYHLKFLLLCWSWLFPRVSSGNQDQNVHSGRAIEVHPRNCHTFIR